ncbi:MAG: hypothetical protein E7641_01950 [Ruminococcaceae bacterium]|nr:hypothetical protein [Oscillospiraceae bacterium]
MRNVNISICQDKNIVLDILGEHSLYLNDCNLIQGMKINVISLAVTENHIVIVADDPDLYGKVAESYREKRNSNIFVFDTNHGVACNIDDTLIDGIHFPFCAGHIATEEDRLFFNKWHGVEFKKDHEYYIAINDADGHFIIDLTKKKFIAEKTFRS